MRLEYHFEEISSTQEYAKELVSQGKDNFVVFSDIQTNGRGRFGRIWNAPHGGLWFSFDKKYSGNVLFTLAVGVAIKEVLEEEYNTKLLLKWPNDLILDEKKVGGIICEKVDDAVIIGIGINTNNKVELDTAINFFEKTQKSKDNYLIMNKIINKIENTVNLDNRKIIETFRKNMAYKGKECFVSVLNQKAKILDIADNGNLIVEVNDEIEEVFSGEINICT